MSRASLSQAELERLIPILETIEVNPKRLAKEELYSLYGTFVSMPHEARRSESSLIEAIKLLKKAAEAVARYETRKTIEASPKCQELLSELELVLQSMRSPSGMDNQPTLQGGQV